QCSTSSLAAMVAIPIAGSVDVLPRISGISLSRQIIESIGQGASDVAPMLSRQTMLSHQTIAPDVAHMGTYLELRRSLLIAVHCYQSQVSTRVPAAISRMSARAQQ